MKEYYFTKSNTHHGCFSFFLNCTTGTGCFSLFKNCVTGTKSRKASQIASKHVIHTQLQLKYRIGKK